MFEPLNWKRYQYFKQVFKFLVHLFHTHAFQSHWRRMTAWFSWFQSHCGSRLPDLYFVEMPYENVHSNEYHSSNQSMISISLRFMITWKQSPDSSHDWINNLCVIRRGSFLSLSMLSIWEHEPYLLLWNSMIHVHHAHIYQTCVWNHWILNRIILWRF